MNVFQNHAALESAPELLSRTSGTPAYSRGCRSYQGGKKHLSLGTRRRWYSCAAECFFCVLMCSKVLHITV